MFSRRLSWPCPPNRLSRLLDERRERGAPLLDLTESNPTRAGLTYPPEITAALADPGAASYDPQPSGLPRNMRATVWRSARTGSC
jgi:alanine-synthesizing transaminase